MSDENLTREEILVLAKAAGFPFATDYADELVAAYRRLVPVVRRLPTTLEWADEPAHVFDPRRHMPGEPLDVCAPN